MSFTAYLRSLGAAVIISALTDMLAPEGSFKKYCRLACGFMVVAVMLSPVTGRLTADGFKAPLLDTAAAEAQARARVLDRHRENLEAITEARFPGCTAAVEVDIDGGVTSLTVEGAGDAAAVMEYAKNELGLEEDRVKINENT